jgi:hypothetical protein
VAIAFAAAGYITPVFGAVLQEAIDVLVILNALRALGDSGLVSPKRAGTKDLAQALDSAHRLDSTRGPVTRVPPKRRAPMTIEICAASSTACMRSATLRVSPRRKHLCGCSVLCPSV